MILVIGGSSYIGSKLYKHFSKKEKLAIGTYYNSYRKGLVYFNLENPNINNLPIDLKRVDYAVICSAITNIDSCKKNEEKAYKINVEGTKKTIEQFFDKNIFPIFLSSGYVFDGKDSNYSESDKPNPLTAYGKHKKIIEDFLFKSKRDFLITRISKIFGLECEDKTLLTSGIKQLTNNEIITCASDQIFSPTYVGDFVEVLDSAIEKKLTGCYNIASPEFMSRFQLITMLKSQLKIKSGKIAPCSILDFKFSDSRPLNTSLNPKKIIKDTGFKFTNLEDCISKLEILVK